MAGRGGKRPGAGRKSNAQKTMERESFLAALGDERAQFETWERMLNSSDERTVLRALMYLTDRVYGRPRVAGRSSKSRGVAAQILVPKAVS